VRNEAKRQHPVAAITQVLQTIRDNWITLVLLLFIGSGGSNIGLYIIAGLILTGLVGGVFSWWRFTYRLADGELHIKQGVFVRKKLYMSRDRIQVIDISAGLIQRIFGLVSVEVKTAGSTSKEAKISAVTRPEAERLKAMLRSTDEQLEQEQEKAAELDPEKIYRLSMKDLLIASSSSGNLGIALSIVGGAYSQIDQLIDEEQMVRFFEWAMPASVGASLVISTLLFILFVSWTLSFLGTLIKYYDFTLEVKKDELVIRRGLFEQKQITVPYNRIQAIRIREELLRQPFGYASVMLESAGYGGEEQLNSATLFPLLKKENVSSFIKEVVPEYYTSVSTVKPPAVALRRYLLRMVWGSLFVIVPAWVFLPYGIYSLFLLVPALLLGFAQYRDAKIGVASDHTLMIQSRTLSRTTAIIKKYRIQSAETDQNPFQRRLGLVSYEVTVTSGSSGQTFSIRDLERGAGNRFLEWTSDSPPREEVIDWKTDQPDISMD
jgi:putative membrane protein